MSTDQVRRFYDRAAPRYDAAIRVFEALLFKGGRAWVCSRARGDVLEIALGTGRNLPCYPPGVRLAGVELSHAMLGIARERAARSGVPVRLQRGDAQCLALRDASVDTVVCTLGLCTIPEERRALAEAARVLRPGGQLLLLEHVRSPLKAVRLGQRLLEPLSLCLGGDHLLRDPLDHLGEAGFLVEEVERSRWGLVERVAASRGPVAR